MKLIDNNYIILVKKCTKIIKLYQKSP